MAIIGCNSSYNVEFPVCIVAVNQRANEQESESGDGRWSRVCNTLSHTVDSMNVFSRVYLCLWPVYHRL